MAPTFWSEIAGAYTTSVAYQFLLHGDGTRDYASETVDVVPWLVRTLVGLDSAPFDLIMLYDPANGLTFGTPDMEQLFAREVLNAQAQAKPQAANPALAQLMGGASAAGNTGKLELPRSLPEVLELMTKAMQLVNRRKPDGKTYQVAAIFPLAGLTFPKTSIGPLPPSERLAHAYLINWSRNPMWRSAMAPLIFLVAPSIAEVADAVVESCYSVSLPAPNYDERLAFIQASLKANKVTLADGMTERRLAAMTAGLLKLHIEDVIVQARVLGTALSADMARQRKDQIMTTRFSGVLETAEATGTLDDIAGLEYLKRYLSEEVVQPLKDGDIDGVPMGILMAGRPGTGKTYIAEKLAASAGVNFVLFRMSNILGGIVGQSEANLEKALQGIQEMTPCIVFIDEVEQSIRRDIGNAGNSVMGNIFGRLLNAMADSRNRGKVVWLMATNRPDLLDAAFKRSGRVDAKFAVFPPDNDDERAQMFVVMARKNRVQLADGIDLQAVARRCVDYTGADIEVIVNKARKVARKDGRETVTQADLEYAVKVIRVATSAEARLMDALAVAEVNDLDNLPPSYRARYEAGEFVEAQPDAEPEQPTDRVGRTL